MNTDTPSNQSIIPDHIKLAIVVLNYKTPGLVIDCLESMRDQIDPSIHHVVIVDNQSGDDSPDQIRSAVQEHNWDQWASLVVSPINGGFAAGNNVGIKAINADTYLLLNSDTLVRPGAIDELMNTLDTNPDIHMLSPRLEWPNGEPQISTFRYRTPITELIYASRLGTIGRLFPKHVVARELEDSQDHLDWVSFACIAIRSQVIEEIGLLDEGYFMYFEDMAFCKKATQAGFNIAFNPKAHVVHLRGGSSPVKERTLQRKRRPSYYYAARSHYFQSSYGLIAWIIANFFWTLGWLLGSLRGRSGAVQREYFDIWSSPKHDMQPTGGSS